MQRCRRDGLIIHPQGLFRSWWDVVSIFLICYIALVLPFRLAFEKESQFGFILMDLFIDLFFIVDFFLNTVTAYVDDGHLIMSHAQIFKHYCKTCAPHT